jgi:hypothetical protein
MSRPADKSAPWMFSTDFATTIKRHSFVLTLPTMGIGGETAARVAAQGKLMRKLSGEGRFALAAVAALAHWRERPVRVSVDDRELIEDSMNLVAVANALTPAEA